jgi:REP element-mobilizing transposase RayT
MRKPRILGARETNYYHVMSRVVNGDFIFDAEEKEFFLRTMRRLESFMGLQVLTYCIMSNHWHILIEVPSAADLDDEELHCRIRAFYPKHRASEILGEYMRATTYAEQTGETAWLDEWREKYISRMGDLSAFVKELKERFSKWYNRKNHRRGTLWEERFKSVLVEDSEHAIATMAAYIELNPVRAGLVEDPRDYRFCGYAEAVAGGAAARSGIEHILFLPGRRSSWGKIAAQYRIHLFSTGEKSCGRGGFNREQIAQVIESGGELSAYELVRCRVRYFTDGVALGSQIFIEEVFEHNRNLFSERRKNGARRIRISHETGLFSLRDLRLRAITAMGPPTPG